MITDFFVAFQLHMHLLYKVSYYHNDESMRLNDDRHNRLYLE